MSNTASTWDSFRDTLVKVLGEFHPKSVMEWGPGVSTLLMQDFPSIELIDTVEHDIAWFWKWRDKMGDKVHITLENDMEKYPLAGMEKEIYDLYFVDGRERERCLDLVNKDALTILHDAERESYQPYIKQFRFVFFEDDGHTVVLTNNEKFAERLGQLQCV